MNDPPIIRDPRDYARWTNSRPRTDENDVKYVGTHADEIAIQKRWVQARVEWIDGCLNTAQQAGTDPMACTGGYKIWPINGTR